VAFYEHIFDCGEQSGRAHSSLGQYYFTIGDYEKSKEEFLASVAHPAPLFLSQTSIVHMHLGFIYLGAKPNERGLIAEPEVASVLRLTPHLEEARDEFEKVIAIDPNSYWAHRFLAMIYDYKGEKQKAALHAGEAARILQSGQNPDKLL
jgi:tetratricopeptide (TPR) repeat protein